MKHSFQAGFGATLLVVIIAVLALGGGVYYVSKESSQPAEFVKQSESDMEMTSEQAQMDKEIAAGSRETATDMELKAEMEAKSDKGVVTDSGLIIDENTEIDTSLLPEPETSGTYTTYADGKLAWAETGDVVLFFHADWCPSCRGLESDIKANLSDIPANTHILKVDYDTETDLKKKYGVVRQHTLVQIDAEGNEIKTLTGLTNTLNQVVSQL